MSLRPWMTFGALLALSVGASYLLVQEDDNGITPLPEKQAMLVPNADPHVDVIYESGDRAKNLIAFGLPADLAKRAERFMNEQEELHGARLKALLGNAEDSIRLAADLCGEDPKVRPRYGALPYLLEEVGDRRIPIELRSVPKLERQVWSDLSPIPEVYDRAELIDDPQPDSTVMAIAAIITKNEETLIDNERPWQVGGLGGWSWSKVISRFPKTDIWVMKYLSLMHLTVEIAQADDGICGG